MPALLHRRQWLLSTLNVLQACCNIPTLVFPYALLATSLPASAYMLSAMLKVVGVPNVTLPQQRHLDEIMAAYRPRNQPELGLERSNLTAVQAFNLHAGRLQRWFADGQRVRTQEELLMSDSDRAVEALSQAFEHFLSEAPSLAGFLSPFQNHGLTSGSILQEFMRRMNLSRIGSNLALAWVKQT